MKKEKKKKRKKPMQLLLRFLVENDVMSFTFHRPRQVTWPHLIFMSQGGIILSQEEKAWGTIIKSDATHPI